jgi:hypothetical protein
MSQNITRSVTFVAENDTGETDSISLSGWTLTRTGVRSTASTANTGGTANTDVAVDLGAVPSGACHLCLKNLSTADNILIRLDYVGTKRTVATVLPGDVYSAYVPSAPYVQAAAANVPYKAIVAEP